MPLSEHEQRVLQQMEKALYAEDPRLATTLKSTASRGGGRGLDRRRMALGVLAAVGGLALVVVGVMSQMIWVGAVGFLAMVLGGAWAATPGHAAGPTLTAVGPDGRPRGGGPGRGGRGGGGGGGGGRGPKAPRGPKGGSFMDRMEQQWDRRKEQGPF
ncbi:DUF3040 domain-containing protein [Ornithinimicrobium kibberense]|uniref:DUF3040 domain-containing protein n=1 Tax=Ornithinimicrobium kibberense TaxID=282060 RepID=A0ABV5V390_9MICO|nr:DUF3040 domain-containing protein [Ornithinimicrobium kibberense]